MSEPVTVTLYPDVSPDVDPAPEDEGHPWWTGKRDAAYVGLLFGVSLQDAAEDLGVTLRTLYEWRRHPLWCARLARDHHQRVSRHEDQLLGLDDQALRALLTHLPANPRTTMEYLHRRGILPKGGPTSLAPHSLRIEYKGERD